MIIVKAKLIINSVVGWDEEWNVLFDDGTTDNEVYDTLEQMAFENWQDSGLEADEDAIDYGEEYGFEYEVIPEVDEGLEIMDLRKSA